MFSIVYDYYVYNFRNNMNKKTLLQNIQNDFVCVTLPQTTIHTAAILITVGNTNFDKGEVMKQVGIKTASSVTTIVGRNILKFALLNLVKKNMTFEKQLYCRMASCYAASTISGLVFPVKRTYQTVLVTPILKGITSGIIFLLQNPKESTKFMRYRFPHEFAAITNLTKALKLNNYRPQLISVLNALN
ncbi:hypothetical protein TRFO_12003 [Tritrichomonas foetus]|uniref:Uncharacterized protein n=1 Tax=Tritrichomonas foetus TaxID=1144522 RepID=A0A1J4J692_9EUKA|nr:hypothetical protein TRFO_12003 [Tritrichomonas foetus]|eukprot:OHS93187.1 hypothetical protein TRFO_12003 [Tritrichomonas foetus]